MNKLIVCTHGNLGEEILKTSEMLVGPIDDVKVFSLIPGQSPKDYLNKIQDYVNLDSKCNYIILVDLFGGTPSNVTAMLTKNNDNVYIVTGVNIGMFLEVYMNLNNYNPRKIQDIAVDVGQNSIINLNRKMKGD